MKSFISSVLISISLGAVLFSMLYFSSKASADNFITQTKSTVIPSPTTCANGRLPDRAINAPANYDPCNRPKLPPPSNMKVGMPPSSKEKRESREQEKKMFSANYPLRNETSIDVDGDGKADKILYQIKPWRQDFEGLLKITSAEGKTLWEHKFFMSERDLSEFLAGVLKYDSVTDWVKSVFNEKADYSFEASKQKIEDTEISEDQIEYIARIYKIKPQKLKSEILQEKINYIFTYRAEWREDFMAIVYVPSLKKFVCYSRGY